MRRAFATIVTPNYLTFALALRHSLSHNNNLQQLYILLVSDYLPVDLPTIEGVTYVNLQELRPSLPYLSRFYYRPFELCSALKPYIIGHLLQNYDHVIYLDSDIYVTHNLDFLWQECSKSLFTFTPHHLTPPPPLPYTSDILISHFGALNSGFYSVVASDISSDILLWLQNKLVHAGFCNSVHGMFGDQKLLGQLLQYVPTHLQILTHPTLNIAFWNAHERFVAIVNDKPYIDSTPVLFFHLSGFKLSDPRVCSYLPPGVNDGIRRLAPWFDPVLNSYRSILLSIGDYSLVHPVPFSSYSGFFLTDELRWLLYQKKYLSSCDPDLLFLQFRSNLKRLKRHIMPLRHSHL